VDFFDTGISVKKTGAERRYQGERVLHTRFPSIEEESNSSIVKHLACQFFITLILMG
jgi:hypothetical protein